MLRIEHANINVSNHQSSLKFYQVAFPDWEVRASGTASWGDKPYKWLHFGDEYHYITLNEFTDNVLLAPDGIHLGINHIGIEVKDIEQLIDNMNKAGFEQGNPGAQHKYRKNAYYPDPDGVEVEFVEYFSDLPAKRNAP